MLFCWFIIFLILKIFEVIFFMINLYMMDVVLQKLVLVVGVVYKEKENKELFLVLVIILQIIEWN
jgi:hypothetical protein